MGNILTSAWHSITDIVSIMSGNGEHRNEETRNCGSGGTPHSHINSADTDTDRGRIASDTSSSTVGSAGSAFTGVAIAASIDKRVSEQRAAETAGAGLRDILAGFPGLSDFFQQLMQKSNQTGNENLAEKFKAMEPDKQGFVMSALVIIIFALDTYGKIKKGNIAALWPALEKCSVEAGKSLWKHKQSLIEFAQSPVGAKVVKALSSGIEAADARNWLDPKQPWVAEVAKQFFKQADKLKKAEK